MENALNMNDDALMAGIDYANLLDSISAAATVLGDMQPGKSMRAMPTVRPEKVAGFTMWDTANITAARMVLGIDPTQKVQMREINRVKVAYRDTITPEKIDALRANKAKWGQFLTYIRNHDGTHNKEQVDVLFGPHEKEAKYHLMGLLMQQNLFNMASLETQPERKAPQIREAVMPKVGPQARIAAKIAHEQRRAVAFETLKPVHDAKPGQALVPVKTKKPFIRPLKPRLDNKTLKHISGWVAQQNMLSALKRYTSLPVGEVF